jgi:hypothetical protein
MKPYNDDEAKVTLGCIVLAIVGVIVFAVIRRFLLTPGGWGF